MITLTNFNHSDYPLYSGSGSIRIRIWYFKIKPIGYSDPDLNPVTKIRSGSKYLDFDLNPIS